MRKISPTARPTGSVANKPLRTLRDVKLLFLLLVLSLHPLSGANALPESFADLAAKLLPSVVNISTTQIIEQGGNPGHNFPQFPPGSPFEDFFKDFMERNGRKGECQTVGSPAGARALLVRVS